MASKTKVMTGPRKIYITQELSDMIGELNIDSRGQFENLTWRIVDLCRKGTLIENRQSKRIKIKEGKKIEN